MRESAQAGEEVGEREDFLWFVSTLRSNNVEMNEECVYKIRQNQMADKSMDE